LEQFTRAFTHAISWRALIPNRHVRAIAMVSVDLLITFGLCCDDEFLLF